MNYTYLSIGYELLDLGKKISSLFIIQDKSHDITQKILKKISLYKSITSPPAPSTINFFCPVVGGANKNKSRSTLNVKFFAP